MTDMLPTAELVAIHWLKGVAGLPVNQINTTVPARTDEFAEHGFVQVTAVGGTRDIETTMRASAIQVDTWAYNKESQRVPWGKANQLAEILAEGTQRSARRVVLPSGFQDALVREVSMVTEPQRIGGEPDFARYTTTITVFWTPVPK